MNVKWFRRPAGRSEPVYSREETSKYTDLMPDGKARQFTFYMEAKSIITRPSGRTEDRKDRLPRNHRHRLERAWQDQACRCFGRRWQELASRQTAGADTNARLDRFRVPWHWDGQAAVIQSRAIDETDYVQPTFPSCSRFAVENSFYHDNAIQPWRIDAQRAGHQCECLSSVLPADRGRARRWPAPACAAEPYGIGRPATAAEIAGWNIDIGRRRCGTCRQEAAASPRATRCSTSNAWPAMARKVKAASATAWSAAGHHRDAKPIKTVGSYWPYARHCSIISVAPCRRTRRSRSATTTSMRCPPTFHLNGLLAGRRDARRRNAERDQDAEPRHVHRRPTARRQKSGVCDGLLTQPGC